MFNVLNCCQKKRESRHHDDYSLKLFTTMEEPSGSIALHNLYDSLGISV